MADGTLTAVVVGGVLTMVSGVVVQHVIEFTKGRTKENAVAAVFAGGVGSILAIARKRQYDIALQHQIENHQLGFVPIILRAQAKRQYIAIFEANLESIGLLQQPLPQQICTFYTYVNAIIEDFDLLSAMPDKVLTPAEILELVGLYKEMRTLLADIFSLGDQIVLTIGTTYPRPMSAYALISAIGSFFR